MSACTTGTPRAIEASRRVAVEVDAERLAAERTREVLEQRPVAAPEVEDARAARAPARDEVEVRPHATPAWAACRARNVATVRW